MALESHCRTLFGVVPESVAAESVPARSVFLGEFIFEVHHGGSQPRVGLQITTTASRGWVLRPFTRTSASKCGNGPVPGKRFLRLDIAASSPRNAAAALKALPPVADTTSTTPF